MASNSRTWPAVEEKLLRDIAIWKSNVSQIPRPAEDIGLVEGASILPTGKGVATIRIGKLDWELTPPSNYTGYCETKDDWLLVSGSEFKVAVRTPCGTRLLQVCPRSEEVELLGSHALLPLSMQKLGLREVSLGFDVSINNLDIDDKLSNSLHEHFFGTKESGTMTSLTRRQTTSHKKRAEVIGEKFGTPFLRCVCDLQTAKNITVVLETILGLSAAYDLTQQTLQQDQQEEFDCDLTGYFYSEQVWEKDCSRRNDRLWVRQQASHAAMKCQTAAAATSEVAEVGAKILLDAYITPPAEDESNRRVVENLSDSGMDEYSEGNPNLNTSLPFDQDTSMNGSSSIFEDPKLSATQQHWNSEYLRSGAANPDGPSLDSLGSDRFEIPDLNDSNNPTGTFPRSHSFGSWQSDVGNDTSSESSWEEVRSLENESKAEDEADVLGAEFSDTESLDTMLRDLDPFGKGDCSPLINEFLSLNMNSPTSSPSANNSDQEENSYVQEERKTKVLQRLASWSSSNSGSWADNDILSSASSVKKMRTPQLETLAEEPACDPEITRLYRSFVFRAATDGNVLQWCSCKFNKLRCSIELKFQVGCFMEDDIATLSTGISRASPLHVEIFLDSTNVRESLLKGNVRVSAYQGVPLGYRGRWNNAGDKTAVLPPVAGLSCYIPHLVRQYLQQEVHVKRSVSGHQFPEGELLTGLMKYVVAQLVFLKHSCCVCNHQTPSNVLTSIVPRPCVKNLCQALYDAWLVVAPPMVLELSTVVDWLKASFNEDPLYEAFIIHFMRYEDAEWSGSYDEKLQRVAKWLAHTNVAASWLKVSMPMPKIDGKFQFEASSEKPQEDHMTWGTKTTPVTKRRKTIQLNPPVADSAQFVETGWMWQSRSSPPLSNQDGEKVSTSACPLNRTSPRAQGESSSQGDRGPLQVQENLCASAGPPKRIPAQAGIFTFQAKRTPPYALGQSRFQRDISSRSIVPSLSGGFLYTSEKPYKINPPEAQGNSSSQDPMPSSWEELIDWDW